MTKWSPSRVPKAGIGPKYKEALRPVFRNELVTQWMGKLESSLHVSPSRVPKHLWNSVLLAAGGGRGTLKAFEYREV